MDRPNFYELKDPNLDVNGILFLTSAKIEKGKGGEHYLRLTTGQGAYFLAENTYYDSLPILIDKLPLTVKITVEARWYGIDDLDTYELTLSEDFKLTYQVSSEEA